MPSDCLLDHKWKSPSWKQLWKAPSSVPMLQPVKTERGSNLPRSHSEAGIKLELGPVSEPAGSLTPPICGQVPEEEGEG